MTYETKIGDKLFPWAIRASYAHSEISNPGVRAGGGTRLGLEFGKKQMVMHTFQVGTFSLSGPDVK